VENVSEAKKVFGNMTLTKDRIIQGSGWKIGQLRKGASALWSWDLRPTPNPETPRYATQVKGQAALARGPASQSDPFWDTPDFTGQAYIPGSSLRIMKASVKKHSVVLGPLKTSIQPRR
jgi:hypothetical protein